MIKVKRRTSIIRCVLVYYKFIVNVGQLFKNKFWAFPPRHFDPSIYMLTECQNILFTHFSCRDEYLVVSCLLTRPCGKKSSEVKYYKPCRPESLVESSSDRIRINKFQVCLTNTVGRRSFWKTQLCSFLKPKKEKKAERWGGDSGKREVFTRPCAAAPAYPEHTPSYQQISAVPRAAQPPGVKISLSN